jgi:hypothetical protein
MKKIIKFLFLFALLFTVTGAVAVSCQKSGGEEDIDGASDKSRPQIKPTPRIGSNKYVIEADGTTISLTSRGFSFNVTAGAITFKNFTCFINRKEEFTFYNDCNLTLSGGSTINLFNGGEFFCWHVTLSGSGSITLKGVNLDVTNYNNKFSAAEGYTLTSTGKVDEGNNNYSCTWSIKKK